MPRNRTARRIRAPRGFSLIELMIAVTIVGVLSTLALGGYKKYMSSARKSEVMSMFGELRAKEEAYRAEFSTYFPITTGGEDGIWPALLAAGEPVAKPWAVGALPAGWTGLGISPGKGQLYCGYSVISGSGGSLAGAGGRGTAYYGGIPPATAWWYATSKCDNDGDPNSNAIFMTSSDRDTMTEKDANR